LFLPAVFRAKEQCLTDRDRDTAARVTTNPHLLAEDRWRLTVYGPVRCVDRSAAEEYFRSVPRAERDHDVAALEIGGPVSSAWREEMLTRAGELGGLKSWIDAQRDQDKRASDLLGAVEAHLGVVGETAAESGKGRIQRLWRGVTGASFERALGNLDAAEVHLLRLAPSSALIPALPSVQAHVNRYLPKDDPRRQAVDRIAERHGERVINERKARLGHARRHALGHEQREMVLSAQHAANSQRRRNFIRLRTFRNLLVGGIVIFAVIGIGLGVLGSISPTTIPLCFTPEAEGRVTVVCPRGETPLGRISADRDLDPDPAIARTATRGDVSLVELLGALGAALAGAAALRNLGSNSTPYAVPVTVALFKLPTGAVTAVVGLQLMRADFVPGLSALDSSAQILGWAVVFGIAQQLVTQFADSQAAGLLENVKGRGAAGDRQLKDE
jgi:hypothetical protein